MTKLVLLFIALVLFSVVGCSTGNSIAGPDSTDQIQTNDPAQKPPVPVDGDPDDIIDGLKGRP